MIKPVELLEQELHKWVKARDKSVEAFKKGLITEEEHDTHLMNLTPKIEEYKFAIRILRDNLE